MHRAFSLVELSIVLVILGLLTGGILAGQSLIRAAELRSITADATRYHTAIMSFRSKYSALPGDMRNAVRFWTAQAGADTDGPDTTCQALTTAATGMATCNGNGDGAVSIAEGFRAWQHMANAGLVEGSFAGITEPSGANRAMPGFNVPQMKISQVGASIMSIGNRTTETGSWFKTSARLLISIGKPFSDNETRIGFMLPQEAWNLDVKLDDGKPSYGKMQSRNDTGCTTTAVTETAEYALTATTQDCILRYFLD